MANTEGTRGGTHDQHVKAGQQSHTGSAPRQTADAAKAGQQNQKSQENNRNNMPDPHAKPGQQGHKH